MEHFEVEIVHFEKIRPFVTNVDTKRGDDMHILYHLSQPVWP